MNIRKKQINPQNIFSSFVFLGDHSVVTNDFDNRFKRIRLANNISAATTGILECLRLSVIAFTGFWSFVNARTGRQEKFHLSYFEMCSITVFTIYCYIWFVLKIRQRTNQVISSQDLSLLAGEYTAGFLASIYIFEAKLLEIEKVSIRITWYTEVLLALLCQQDLTNVRSVELIGEIGDKEVFQLNQLTTKHPSVKILLNINTETICFNEIKDRALKVDASILIGILDNIDFNENLKILILMHDLDSRELQCCQHLIVLLRIRNPKLSITIKCGNTNVLSDLAVKHHSTEITQNANLNEYGLVFFRKDANTILTNSAFQRFVYFYEPGAFNHNTLNHFGRYSISLNIADLQATPLSKQSFKISIN